MHWTWGMSQTEKMTVEAKQEEMMGLKPSGFLRTE